MYFEEFSQGDRYNTRPRVVTATDVDSFAISTGADNPLFLDDKFAREMGFNQRIAPGLLTLSLTVGLVYSLGLFDHLVALLNLEVNFLAPVYPGDEIKGTVEVIDKREAKRGDSGIVMLRLNTLNQKGKQVLDIPRFVCLLKRKGQPEPV
jgi:acyl dehydratase